MQFAMEGYGCYWYLIEKLAEAGGYLPLDTLGFHASQMAVEKATVEAIVKNFDLFIIKEDTFFSVRLLDHIKLREKLREAGRKGAEKRWIDSPPSKPPNGNKKKVNEEKEKLFDTFWSLYPRKGSPKKKAKEKFMKLSEKDIEAIISAMPKFAQSVKGTDNNFIPHPTTWLNQERWKDEIVTGTNKNSSALW